MKGPGQNLLILFKHEFKTERAIEQEFENIQHLLLMVESSAQFFQATELVNRNRITSDSKKILKECSYPRLRPFRFLINKN